MRLPKLSTLVLILATPWLPPHAAQGGAPKPRPFTPPTDCFKQVILRAPYDNTYARRLIGDEWISGCIGDEGPCEMVVWVPC